MHYVSKRIRISEPTTKIWVKIDPYFQRRRCSPMTLVSGNIRFMRIFAGIPWTGASNDSGIIENVDFQGFWTLCLRSHRKWGQHYYMVLFSPLSPFHSPQNIWPWLTMNGHCTLYFLNIRQCCSHRHFTIRHHITSHIRLIEVDIRNGTQMITNFTAM